MDKEEAHAQRPVSLGITVEDEAAISEPAENPTGQITTKDSFLPQEDSIDLGGLDFVTPHEVSSATPTESLMDRLNDQMMESVMISDSPNNSEEDDVAPIDSYLDGGEQENVTAGNIEEHSEIGNNTTEIKVSVDQLEKESSEEETKDKEGTRQQVTASVSPQDDTLSPAANNGDVPVKGIGPKDEAVPVCTIFSQSTLPKSLVPDGFQPTLIKSPSFTMGSAGGGDEAVTPSKLGVPLVCQPSPSLSKFFADNEQANPASDFFDSFTVSSSFISVSNPNADLSPGSGPPPVALTPERQLSSTSSISTPGVLLDSASPAPSPVFGPIPTEPNTNSKPLPPQTISTPTLASVPVSSTHAQPFNQLQAVFSGSDDPFATALSLSEVDRRHDAWLPCEETRKVLISVATQQYGPAYVESNKLTMPGLKFDNLQVGHFKLLCNFMQ